MPRTYPRAAAAGAVFLLACGPAEGLRVTLRLPHDMGDDDGPDYEFLPYVDTKASAGSLVDTNLDRLVPPGATFGGCSRTDRACLVAEVAARMERSRAAALVEGGDDALLTLGFQADHGDVSLGRMEITVRRGDTPRSAAERFCRSQTFTTPGMGRDASVSLAAPPRSLHNAGLPPPPVRQACR